MALPWRVLSSTARLQMLGHTRQFSASPGFLAGVKIEDGDDLTRGNYDLIGPPRPGSNLRPVKFVVKEDESALEVRVRELRQETQGFNQAWWEGHNRQFKEGRELYIKGVLEATYPDQPDRTTLSADEMSIFYRFLKSRFARQFSMVIFQGLHE
jgi:hypothetical protein